ncbi:MAG: cyclic nucleotide-binding domain-containing protein [Phycisphaera sp.]|nr:cyclic nucleotide-binding domain-containing protein [Phycisphaera sp.]
MAAWLTMPMVLAAEATHDADAAGGLGTVVAYAFGLLLLAAGVLAISKRSGLPFTVMLVVVGVVLAHLAHNGPTWLAPLSDFRLSPDLILFVFLPTLIFESAFNLDGRQLRKNLTPVMTLAIPGLILSTGVIGAIVAALTDIPLPAALLLGAILSATDPVAVIAMFKQLGAPRRLTVLVEGESLFNDATSIVVAMILLDVAMRGQVSGGAAAWGVAQFFIVFFGGLAVGGVLAGACGWLLSKVNGDEAIEISLTTVLAYGSFVIAEHYLHVSGVMAGIAAAVLMGGWGRTKISPSVAGYLHHFWEYAAYVANAMIFLLVGLSVDLNALWASAGVLAIVVLAMLVSRAATIFGLVPLIGRLTHPISGAFQAVMYWGGLRGAIALALALHLPHDFPFRDTFIALVTGAVLFTLLVQGVSIEWLVRRLGLDRLSPREHAMQIEGLIAAKQRALAQVPELQASGLFSPQVADAIRQRCQVERDELLATLDKLRDTELDAEHEASLLMLQCLAVERNVYYDLFGKGHLSERAYRDLLFSIELQGEAVRHHNDPMLATLHTVRRQRWIGRLLRASDRVAPRLARRLRTVWTAREYERAWGRHLGSTAAIDWLGETAHTEHVPDAVLHEVRQRYERWREQARSRIDRIAEQFPEFVQAMQQRLGDRMVNQAQSDAIRHEIRTGAIPHAIGDRLIENVNRTMPRHPVASQRLHIDPTELLRRVPFFRDTPPDEFARVARHLREITTPSGEDIIRQGARDDTLYLIARGVVRVVREQSDGRVSDLATLVAGEFFGEMALLFGQPRSATCRAVTPCALYALRRADLDAVARACPAITNALMDAARERSGVPNPAAASGGGADKQSLSVTEGTPSANESDASNAEPTHDANEASPAQRH